MGSCYSKYENSEEINQIKTQTMCEELAKIKKLQTENIQRFLDNFSVM